MTINKSFGFLCVNFFILTSFVLAKGEPSFSDSVETLLSDSNINSSRLKATIALENSGDPKAVSYLILALKDKSYPYRFAAIHALGVLGSDEAVNFLEHRWRELECKKTQGNIKSESTSKISEKAYIAAALCKLGKDSHVQYLYNAIESTEKTVRYNVAMSLGMVSNKKSKEILYKILKNDSADLPRCGAAFALVELNDPDIIDTLRLMERNGKGTTCFNSLVQNE